MNLETKQDVLRFCELRRAEMVRCFERLGRFECNGYSFGAYVFATHAMQTPADPTQLDDYKPGRKLGRVEAQLCRLPPLIYDLLPPEQHTAVFGHVVKAFAKVTRSVGALLMSETWHVSYAGKAAGKSPEEIRGELPENLEDAPGRREALFMHLEHGLTGRRIWFAQIQRNPTLVEPWQENPMEDAKGRLVDLVDWRS